MSNILKPAIEDTVHLCAALENRFLDLCGAYMRVKGVQLPIPKNIQRAMLLWRQMMVRFKQDDFRHSDDELKALKEVAQWTVDENNTLRNQPSQMINWAL